VGCTFAELLLTVLVEELGPSDELLELSDESVELEDEFAEPVDESLLLELLELLGQWPSPLPPENVSEFLSRAHRCTTMSEKLEGKVTVWSKRSAGLAPAKSELPPSENNGFLPGVTSEPSAFMDPYHFAQIRQSPAASM
jgi:hypothetical protein